MTISEWLSFIGWALVCAYILHMVGQSRGYTMKDNELPALDKLCIVLARIGIVALIVLVYWLSGAMAVMNMLLPKIWEVMK